MSYFESVFSNIAVVFLATETLVDTYVYVYPQHEETPTLSWCINKVPKANALRFYNIYYCEACRSCILYLKVFW